MKIYLTDNVPKAINHLIAAGCKYILLSYYYVKSFFGINIAPGNQKDVLFDSGAFSMLKNNEQMPEDLDDYIISYAHFLKENNIILFFEMDLYNKIGIAETERTRAMIEKITERQVIPVFHRSLGKIYFHQLIEEYKYVAIGGLAIKDIKREEHKYLKYFIEEAHKVGCKIHGLGFCPCSKLSEYKFDSVDCSSWNGGRYGHVYIYKKGKLQQRDMGNNMKLIKNTAPVFLHNAQEWAKFAQYAERFL